MKIDRHSPPDHSFYINDRRSKSKKSKSPKRQNQAKSIIEDIQKGASSINVSSTTFSNQTLRYIVEESVKRRDLKEISIYFHNLNTKGKHNLKHLLHHKSNWKSLDFRIKSLSVCNASIFSSELPNCKFLKNLKITVEYEKDNSTASFIDGLLKNPVLDSLSLTLHFSIKRCHLLAIENLLQSTRLKNFSLKSKGWTDEKIGLLIKGIKSARKLQSVDLSDNDFSSLTKSRSDLLEPIRHLQKLQLDQTQFDRQDMRIQKLISGRDRIHVSIHAKKRLKERKITAGNIKSAVSSGTILRCNSGFEKGIAKAYDKASGVQVIISLDKFLIITAYQVYKNEKKSKHQRTAAERLKPFSIGTQSKAKPSQQKLQKITLVKTV